MVKIEYLDRGITKDIILDFDDIYTAVEYFEEVAQAKIEHGDITYISGQEV